MELTDLEKGWISCAIDTEGSFAIQILKNKTTKRGYSYNVYLNMANNNLDFMKRWRHLVKAENKKFYNSLIGIYPCH